jgi:subtilisin-like proprotein convertase family protein
VALTLKWTTDEGESATVPVAFRVLRGNLAVQQVDYGTPGAAGGIKPGATGQVYLTVQNTGNEPIANGSIGGTAGTCISAAGGTARVESLAPGASARLANPLEVTIDPQCKNGATAQLALVGTYAGHAEEVPLGAPAQLIAGEVTQTEQDLPNLGLAIPDDGPAVKQKLHVDKTGELTDIGVHVKITHPYAPDLQIKLIAPDGTEVMLRDRVGPSGKDVDDIYGLGGRPLPALEALKGREVSGDWQLSVQDTASGDTGTLTEVDLTLRGYLN